MGDTVKARDTIETLLYKAARARYDRCEVYSVSITPLGSSIDMVNNRLAGELTIVRVKGNGYGIQINNLKKGKVKASYY